MAMVRLLDGTYGAEAARARLKEVADTVPSAFVMPHGNGLAVYLASFYDQGRADAMTRSLTTKGFEVSQVHSKIMLERTLLTTEALTQEAAEALRERLDDQRINAALLGK